MSLVENVKEYCHLRFVGEGLLEMMKGIIKTVKFLIFLFKLNYIKHQRKKSSNAIVLGFLKIHYILHFKKLNDISFRCL